MECKTEGDLKDLLKTMVAFANTVHPGHIAEISIGEKDDGYRALCEGRLVTDQDAELLPGMCDDIDAGIAALMPYL